MSEKIIHNVNTTAGDGITLSTSAASAKLDISDFDVLAVANRAADPTPVGLSEGDLYYNNASNELRIYTGASFDPLAFLSDVSALTHDGFADFVANEHIDHSSVDIATAAGTSGLSGGGDLTSTRNLVVDIAGTTAETSVQDADSILIQDDSAGALREMTRANFIGSAEIAMQTNKITGLGDPTNAQDAATKIYVDSLAAGLDPKESVRAATTADVGGTYAAGTISALGAGVTIDSVTLIAGDRVLLKDQTDIRENGIYVYDGIGELNRAADHDGTPTSEVSSGNFTFVEQGTANATKGFVLQGNGELSLDTDSIVWAQFSEAGAMPQSLDISYDGGGSGLGRTIAVDAGAVQLTGTHATNNALEVSVTGSGDGINLDMSAADSGWTGVTIDGINPANVPGFGMRINSLDNSASISTLHGGVTNAGQLIDQNGSAPGLYIDSRGASSGYAGLVIDSINPTNVPGFGMRINSVDLSASASTLHGGITNAGAMIDQNGSAPGMYIDSRGAGNGYAGLVIDSPNAFSFSNGFGMRINSQDANVSGSTLHGSITNAGAMIDQDGTAPALYIDSSGAGASYAGLVIDSPAFFDGYGMRINSPSFAPAAGSAGLLVDVDGAAPGVVVDASDGTGIGFRGRASAGVNVLEFDGSTSGVLGFQPAAATTSYNLTFPAAVASAAGQVLTSDASGVLTWETVGASVYELSEPANTIGNAGDGSFLGTTGEDLHGLGAVPNACFLYREVAAGEWELLDFSSFLTVTSTGLLGDTSSLGGDTIKIVVMAI